jgi:hypothetical protein
MKLTLAKALKLKNKKVATINKLKQRIMENNSYNSKNIPSYNSSRTLEEYNKEVEELVKLKIAINTANVKITGSILQLGEIKTKIIMLRSLNTTEGEQTHGFGSNRTTDILTATITEIQADKMVEELESQLETIQDSIDYFNATTEIEI